MQSDPAKAGQVLQAVQKALFVPHNGGQKDVLASDARFRTIRAGRRWGKTKLASREIVMQAITQPGSMNWWIANSYRNVRRGYREVVRQLPPMLLAKPAPSSTANELILHLKNGAMIEFYSGGSPDSLAGEGVDFVVVDEAGLIPEIVWTQMIRPTLMDREGSGLIISTPRGHNWFWKIYQLGQQGDPRYASWHFPSWTNPYLPKEDVEELRRTLPEVIFQQEIAAEFIATAASIFRISDPVIQQMPYEPAGHVYLGVDLAKKVDFTVLHGIRDVDRRVCFHERWKDVSWPQQRERILDAVQSISEEPGVTGVTTIVDSTGVGDVIFEDLEMAGIDIIPIKFTNDWKQKAVTLLAADLERRRAFILEDQIPEFETYEYEITDTGKYKFEAASGHDDEVSAALLAHWGLEHEGAPDVKVMQFEAGLEEEIVEEEPEPEIIRPDSSFAIMQNSEAWVA